MGSQVYKLELPKQWRIHNVFHVCLVGQNITRKGWVDEKTAEQLEFKAGSDNEEYEVEDICDSVVYVRKSEAGYLPGFYYLVSWKNYTKDKNTWKPGSAVQYLQKLVSIFYKYYPDKSKITSPPIKLALPMAKRIASPNINGKRKRG